MSADRTSAGNCRFTINFSNEIISQQLHFYKSFLIFNLIVTKRDVFAYGLDSKASPFAGGSWSLATNSADTLVSGLRGLNGAIGELQRAFLELIGNFAWCHRNNI